MTMGQGHDTSLGHGQLLREIFRSNLAVRSYGPNTDFRNVSTVTLTLGQGHDTPLGHGQLLCEILSRSNLAVRSYDPDTDFGYVCTVNLTLKIWSWVKVMVMTHPSVMDNNCVKYQQDPTWQWGVIARIRIWVCVHCDLDLEDMNCGQGHDTPLGHGQQLCELLSRLYTYLQSYGSDTMWTDRRTGWFLYTPKTLFARGGGL